MRTEIKGVGLAGVLTPISQRGEIMNCISGPGEADPLLLPYSRDTLRVMRPTGIYSGITKLNYDPNAKSEFYLGSSVSGTCSETALDCLRIIVGVILGIFDIRGLVCGILICFVML